MTESNNNNLVNKEEKLFLMLKLDKSRKRWRLLAFLFFIFALLSYSALKQQSLESKNVNKDYIAEVKIEGIILEDDYRMQRLDELKDDKNIKAVILTIDSPGGSMVPGLELLEKFREIQKEKPVVVQMKTVAASAGYMISLAGEYVVANKATLTGSVGVLMPLVDATELAKKIGIESAEVTSGDLKSITSPIAKRTSKAQEFLQETVNELQIMFMDEVKIARKLSPEVEKLISDGRVVIGQKALEYNLIDSLGGKNQLVAYLKNQKNIKDLDVEQYSLEEPEETDFHTVLADKLVSGMATKLELLLTSSIATPKVIAK